MDDVVNLNAERRLFSPDIVDIILQLNTPGFAVAQGLEIMASNVFVGLEPNKSKKSGFELVVEAAQMRRMGNLILY